MINFWAICIVLMAMVIGMFLSEGAKLVVDLILNEIESAWGLVFASAGLLLAFIALIAGLIVATRRLLVMWGLV